tara:strand:- start:3527 stop:4186 length:660 start_codon:yes stop_codon:yes gene_type:complete
MSEIRGVVQQDNYEAQAEGQFVGARANPRGELITPHWFTQLALDGRVYNISTSVQEAGDLLGETSPGANNVNPSILVDVPSGTTIIPLEFTVMPEGTGTTGDWTIIRMSTDDATRYSSGGAAITPINMRKDDPNTSSTSAYHGGTQIVATANTDDDTFWYGSVDTSIRVNQPNYWSALTSVPPILIGPAALLVFVQVSNVDEEVLWSLKWAEFSTSVIT